jgi:hypothetical protein
MHIKTYLAYLICPAVFVKEKKKKKENKRISLVENLY